MEVRSVVIGVFSEQNCKNPPKIKGFTTISKISKRKFHVATYSASRMRTTNWTLFISISKTLLPSVMSLDAI